MVTTVGHPFWVENVGWVDAEKLTVGDLIKVREGESVPVKSVETISTTTIVYNFDVEPTHNYFVSKDGFLVHNPGICSVLEKPLKTRWTKAERTRGWRDKGYPEGRAPRREVIVQNRKTGEIETRIESKELHHLDPRRNMGGNNPENLQSVWPQEHESIDPHRHINYDVITEIPPHAYTDDKL